MEGDRLGRGGSTVALADPTQESVGVRLPVGSNDERNAAHDLFGNHFALGVDPVVLSALLRGLGSMRR